jgi:2-phospho-L-lactate guanylyltransferase
LCLKLHRGGRPRTPARAVTAPSVAVRPVAVLPVKDLDSAKQRLAGVLDPPQRRDLYRAMFQDVLSALAAARWLAGVLVVTRDPWAGAIARENGFDVLEEPNNDGHTAASSLGARTLAERDAQAMLQLPGDLPTLRGEDVDALIEAHRGGDGVTIAPSLDRRGSNGVLCAPPDCLPLRFGEDSFIPHLARCFSLGMQPTVVDIPGFAHDVDTPADLARLMAGRTAAPPGWHTRQVLRGLPQADG